MSPQMKKELRWREFSGPIMDLAMHNSIIRRILDCYVAGQIITKEEALSQMVVALATDWDERKKLSYDLALKATIPPHFNP